MADALQVSASQSNRAQPSSKPAFLYPSYANYSLHANPPNVQTEETSRRRNDSKDLTAMPPASSPPPVTPLTLFTSKSALQNVYSNSRNFWYRGGDPHAIRHRRYSSKTKTDIIEESANTAAVAGTSTQPVAKDPHYHTIQRMLAEIQAEKKQQQELPLYLVDQKEANYEPPPSMLPPLTPSPPPPVDSSVEPLSPHRVHVTPLSSPTTLTPNQPSSTMSNEPPTTGTSSHVTPLKPSTPYQASFSPVYPFTMVRNYSITHLSPAVCCLLLILLSCMLCWIVYREFLAA